MHEFHHGREGDEHIDADCVPSYLPSRLIESVGQVFVRAHAEKVDPRVRLDAFLEAHKRDAHYEILAEIANTLLAVWEECGRGAEDTGAVDLDSGHPPSEG